MLPCHAQGEARVTSIEWTMGDDGTAGETWNPTDGCKVCSPGCANCYAMRFAGRFAKPGERYHGLVTIGKNKRAIWTGKGRLDAGKLAKPLRWKKPRRIFVNSMSDLFYEEFANEEIAAVFGVMAACPQHTFQILTKRAKRMREWFKWVDDDVARSDWMRDSRRPNAHPAIHKVMEWLARTMPPNFTFRENVSNAWPLPNVHLGVSTENQDAFDERWPYLLGCPAAVWWFSAEPLLGGIDMTHMLADFACKRGKLWLVAGCESGPGARPAKPDWYKSLRDQCKEAGVPFFLKQAEETADLGKDRLLDIGDDDTIAFGDGSKMKARRPGGNHIIGLPYLDGVQHREFPKEMTP